MIGLSPAIWVMGKARMWNPPSKPIELTVTRKGVCDKVPSLRKDGGWRGRQPVLTGKPR